MSQCRASCLPDQQKVRRVAVLATLRWLKYPGKKRGGVHAYTFRNIYCIRATARNQVSRFWIWIYLFVAFLMQSPTAQVNLFSAYSFLKYIDKLPVTDSSLSTSICLLLCCLEAFGRNQDSACLDAANRTLWRRSVLTVIIRVSCNQNHCSKENFGKSWTHIQTSCSGHFCGSLHSWNL